MYVCIYIYKCTRNYFSIFLMVSKYLNVMRESALSAFQKGHCANVDLGRHAVGKRRFPRKCVHTEGFLR